MSEAPSDPSQTDAQAADRAAPTAASPGALLRQAREAKGLSVAAIATQMNLDIRTVEALEADAQAKLPAPIFVRGYLRSFARLVGASEAEVLQAYQAHAPAEPVPHRVGLPRSSRRALRAPAMPWRGIFTTLLLLLLIGAAIEFGPRLIARFMDAEPVEQPAQLELPLQDEASDDAPPTLVAPDAGVMELSLPPAAPESPDGSATPPASPTDGLSAEPEATVNLTETQVADSEPAAASEPAADAASDPAAVAPVEPPPNSVQFEIRVKAESWIEIRAADGSKLMFGLIRGGEQRVLSGPAPVSFLIGNIDAVELRVDGTVFDLDRHARGKVARFKLDATT